MVHYLVTNFGTVNVKSLGLALCLAFFLAGLTACGTNEPALTPPGTPGVAEWENLPLYPDAQDVSRDTTNALAMQNVVFTTTSDLPQVLDFYQTNLRRRGWITLAELLNRPVPAEGYDKSEEQLFFWIDRTGATPWRSEFAIDFVERADRLPGVSVRLHIERWPDPKRVPIYPGARALETHDTLKQGFPAHVTTYLAPVSSAVVLSYYQQLMPTYGWRLSADQGGNTSLNYGYKYGGGEWVLASLGELITATADPEGTHVELQATGTELPVGSPVAVPSATVVPFTPPAGYAWQDFRDGSGGFTVLMLGTRDNRTYTEDGPQGKWTVHSYSSYEDYGPVAGQLVCNVTYSDYPTVPGDAVDPEQALKDAQARLLRGEARLVGEQTITLSGFPGRDLEFTIGAGRMMYARVYLVNDRLYTVTALNAFGGDSATREAYKFLDSFQLLQ